MAKKGEISHFAEQKKNKPVIEDLTGLLLDGEIKDGFLIFYRLQKI